MKGEAVDVFSFFNIECLEGVVFFGRGGGGGRWRFVDCFEFLVLDGGTSRCFKDSWESLFPRLISRQLLILRLLER